MATDLDKLLSFLIVEEIGEDVFRGTSPPRPRRVFGGQVAAQSLDAATRTVDKDRLAHAMHAYFLRPGDPAKDIQFEVERRRDGRSFTTRDVVARQDGVAIFNTSISFHIHEEGLEHNADMPDVPGPNGLKDLFDVPAELLDRVPMKMRRFLTEQRPFEFRPVEAISFTEPVALPPVKHCWIRAVDALPDDLALHQNLLAYVSDYELLGASVLPHGLTFGRGNVIMASLDHGLWFHRRFRVDQWLLYAIDSPNAAAARGFARGQLFTEDGVLVASTVQEGLIRVVEPEENNTRTDPRLQV